MSFQQEQWTRLEKKVAMKCYACGSMMVRIQTDLPFKVNETTIALIKALPVLQCERCREFTLADPVLERIDTILRQADARTELEIVRFGELTALLP